MDTSLVNVTPQTTAEVVVVVEDVAAEVVDTVGKAVT